VDVSLAALADYALADKADRLSIIGIFDKIYAASTPVVHRSAYLVMVLQSTRGDYNRDRDIRVEITDQDGRPVAGPIDATVRIDGNPESAPAVNMILHLEQLPFPAFGPYIFTIFVGGDVKKTIRLELARQPETHPS
jgi:hypothetical protein